MTDLRKLASAAEQAAYAAGAHLRSARSRISSALVTHQTPAQVLAAIEREVVELVREVVGKYFPGHEVDLEEPARTKESRGSHWMLRPLDGASNYLRGASSYGVSIAWIADAQPKVGVVFDPSSNEFFGAIHGVGAVMNGTPIRCAAPRAPKESNAATVFPRAGSPRMPGYMTELGHMMRGFGSVRPSSSSAIEMARLAAGRLDAFWQHDLEPGESAAAILLLQESGAMFHARDGIALLESRSVLACSPELFEPFLSVLVEGVPEADSPTRDELRAFVSLPGH